MLLCPEKKFFPLTLNHSRADMIKAQASGWCFLQVEWTKDKEDFLPLGIRKCALREKCSFQKNQKNPLSEHTALLPLFLPAIPPVHTYSQTASNPHAFLQADSFLLLGGAPSFLGWGSCIHVTPAHCGLNEILRKGCQLPQFSMN